MEKISIQRKILNKVKKHIKPEMWAKGRRKYKLFINNFPFLFYKTMKVDGINLTYRANTSDEFIIKEMFQKEEYRLSKEFTVNEDDVIIDIGAQIGVFSIYCANKAKNGKVYSFEPFKKNFQMLVKNIKKNNLKNIHAFNLGVSSKKEKIKLYLSENSGGHSSLKKFDRFVTINCISLKDIFNLNKILKCNLLKIDCEGAEYDILLSTPSRYFKRIEKMIIEYHEFPGSQYKGKDLKKFLEKHSYNVKSKKFDNNISGILYVKKC